MLRSALRRSGAGAWNGNAATSFTTIYESEMEPVHKSGNPISALRHEGVVDLEDGRCFAVEHGTLGSDGCPDVVWRLSNTANDDWLSRVGEKAWKRFRDIGMLLANLPMPSLKRQ